MTIHRTLAAAGCGCDGPEAAGGLVSVDEALAMIAGKVRPIARSEAISLGHAGGRILARPVRSRAMAPPFDNAAMDGYAVATRVLTGTGPWELPVVARVPAGQEPPAFVRGAARIFTGAPVPIGADAVVKQEDVGRDGDTIHLSRRPVPGENIRRAGSDIARGATILEPGRRLGSREIAACAAAGAGVLRVRRRLRVALLVTGDEVRRCGGAREAAQIWDVNTPMLTVELGSADVDLVAAAHGADSVFGLISQMGDMAARADLVITTGGISVGEEDHVKPAFAALGGEILFSGVAMKPGKPVSVGRIGPVHWLGLPGNPVSAFVTWQILGVALMRRLTGEVSRQSTRRHVITATEFRRKPGRCEFRPARLAGFDMQGREVVRFEEATHSGRVGTLSAADGLMFLPAEADQLPAGALVEFQPFCTSRGA